MNTGAPPPIEPRRLELSINPEDGSLLTAPLLSVVMAATDGLYNDIYDMVHGQLQVTSAQPAGGPEDDTETAATSNAASAQEDNNPASQDISIMRKEKMSNLSFAQRRHELAWRLYSHGRTLTHVAALTAASATTNLAKATQVSTKALQHARTAWVQADEAQDALYFFHAQLFPARAAPHDIYGALDTLVGGGSWFDLPQDLQLTVDRYETSQEKAWSVQEVNDRWQMAVRDKLLRGEVGWMRAQQPQQRQQQQQVPWKISLKGGIVRLMHGSPKTTLSGKTTKTTYPIEAVLTVLSTSQPAQWTLVSIEVHAQAKTGQSNHQLDTSNRQRYDLHRLCALAMSKEEVRAQNEAKDKEKTATNGTSHSPPTTEAIVARPLHTLFQVAHVFGLSWQLEILSAQAQSLRRGIWGTSSSSIVVTPVQFFENRRILGIVSISFWSVDDRYGPPSMGELQLDEDSTTRSGNATHTSSGDSVSTVSRSINTPSVANQLTLSVTAEPNVGIRVSLSGAESIMEYATVQPHIRSTIHELLEATSNPFQLSASEALLAATRLCAERKCHAMVQSLPSFLPDWITLQAEKVSITVAARIRYDFGEERSTPREPVILFRMTCDARTGTFTSTFSRSAHLLQYLACNDPKAASDSTALRMAQYSRYRRANSSRSAGVAAALASGRAVRDAFEGLSRSMNVLGQRTGVGGGWRDKDDLSASLRQRAIQLACKDVSVSLISCCGMAAVYGLSAVSMGVATGITAQPDMAGGSLPTMNGIQFLACPPLALLVDQQLVETTTRKSDGERAKQSHTEQEFFGISCTASVDGLKLYGAEIHVRMDTPIAVPNRTKCTLSSFQQGEAVKSFQSESESEISMESNVSSGEPPAKKLKSDGGDQPDKTSDLMAEVEYFAAILSDTLEL